MRVTCKIACQKASATKILSFYNLHTSTNHIQDSLSWNFCCTGFPVDCRSKVGSRKKLEVLGFIGQKVLIPICALKIKDSFTSVSTFQSSLKTSFLYWLKTSIFSKINFMTHWWDCSCKKKGQVCFKMSWTIAIANHRVPDLSSSECQLG